MTAGPTLESKRGSSWVHHPIQAGFLADPDRFSANQEPALDDLLGDPIAARLMASDGVRRDEVRAIAEAARARLTGR